MQQALMPVKTNLDHLGDAVIALLSVIVRDKAPRAEITDRPKRLTLGDVLEHRRQVRRVAWQTPRVWSHLDYEGRLKARQVCESIATFDLSMRRFQDWRLRDRVKELGVTYFWFLWLRYEYSRLTRVIMPLLEKDDRKAQEAWAGVVARSPRFAVSAMERTQRSFDSTGSVEADWEDTH